MDVSETNTSTSVSVGCGLNSQPQTSVKTLLLLSQCAWVPLISTMSRSAGRPWNPPSAPESCRCELSQQSHVPLPLRTAQSWWEQGFWRWISVSSATTAQIKAPAVGSAPTEAAPGEQSCWQPGRSQSSALQPPPALPPRAEPAWWGHSPGQHQQSILPLPEAQYSSDPRASGLVSVAGGTSGLHINYLMNVALFSVHESFMTRVQFGKNVYFL